MKNEVNDLIEEIINFSNIIAYSDDPADSDFQNACQLFSAYLEHRFSEIKTSLNIQACQKDSDWIINELNTLSNLISLPDQSTTPYTQWTHNLFQHCEELQRDKLAIA